jgi:acyl-ACP thioesterase
MNNNNSDSTLYTNHYFLRAGECDAQGLMPLPLIVGRLIDTATDHANSLHIGYDNLNSRRMGWVLSRLLIDIDSRPGINSYYNVETWIEEMARMMSNRCFEVTDPEGRAFIHARSFWMAIDLDRRTAVDLSAISTSGMINSERRSSVARPARPASPAQVTSERNYTFRFTDLDFYRHVNSVRYVEMVLNSWPLERFDRQRIASIEIAFNHECHFGDTVSIRCDDSAELCSVVEVTRAEQRVMSVRIAWQNI